MFHEHFDILRIVEAPEKFQAAGLLAGKDCQRVQSARVTTTLIVNDHSHCKRPLPPSCVVQDVGATMMVWYVWSTNTWIATPQAKMFT